MLAASWLDLSPDKVFSDRLSRKEISAKGRLPVRDRVICPPRLGETIYLPSLRVLGWDNLDTMRAATIAFAHGCRIYCVDTGELFSVETSAPEMINALTRAEEARRRARTSPAQDAQLSRRAERLKAGLAIARREWPGGLTVAQIAALAQLSTRTLYAHLPPRSEARAENKRGKNHA